MHNKLIAKVSATINAPIAKVWDALVTPEIIKRYFFGTTVVSDWKEGSSIIWKGEWEGKTYQDKGVGELRVASAVHEHANITAIEEPLSPFTAMSRTPSPLNQGCEYLMVAKSPVPIPVLDPVTYTFRVLSTAMAVAISWPFPGPL